MAGDRFRFDDAIQKANDAVWVEKWADAARFYRRALDEFPQDVATLMGYAWALLNNKAYDEATEVYQQLTTLNPADPGPYERIAELHQQQGDMVGAAQMYSEAAERYARQGLTSKYLAALEASVRLEPRNEAIWQKLFEQYREQHAVDDTVAAALWLVYLRQDSDRQGAIEICRQAQTFVPHEPRLGQALMLLQSNRGIPRPPDPGSQVPGGAETEEIAALEIEEETGTPLSIAGRRALAKLAEALFSDDMLETPGPMGMEASLLIGKAVDAQTRGDLAEALQSYEQLLAAGIAWPSLHLNVGLIHHQQLQYDRAVTHFEQALADPEYVLGAHFALGECHLALRRPRQALEHFLAAIKALDLATAPRDHAEDLALVYESLSENLLHRGKTTQQQAMAESFARFLEQPGWEGVALEARRRLDDLMQGGAVLALASLVGLPDPGLVLDAIANAQRYQQRKQSHAALEELFWAIGMAPDYLPLHQLLGKILHGNGHIEAAIAKYHMVARTYVSRGQTAQALALYKLIVAASPLDIETHRRIAELLMQRGRFDEALEQYMRISEAYYQLAQPERARETYAEALRLATHGSPKQEWELRILRQMADLDQQRLDWNAAIKDNEEIIRIAPDDEGAYLALYRLYPRTGRAHLALATLDRLLKRLLAKRDTRKMIQILEDLVAVEPDNIGLRTRLAQLALNLGDRERALEHLDVLGDMQLEAGQTEAVIKTLEAILALNPANRDAYVTLYQEITGREPPAPRAQN